MHRCVNGPGSCGLCADTALHFASDGVLDAFTQEEDEKVENEARASSSGKGEFTDGKGDSWAETARLARFFSRQVMFAEPGLSAVFCMLEIEIKTFNAVRAVGQNVPVAVLP